jgi:hypothetical protein
MFAVCFFAFLRISEIVQHRATDMYHGLSLNDVQITQNVLSLTIRFSKTDQQGRKSVIQIARQQNTTCPVSLVRSYLSIRPKAPASHLFIHMNGKSVTQYQFRAPLAKSLVFVGHTSAASHLFRMGAAAAAAMMAVPDQTMVQWGRWQSDAYRSYIGMHLAWLGVDCSLCVAPNIMLQFDREQFFTDVWVVVT